MIFAVYALLLRKQLMHQRASRREYERWITDHAFAAAEGLINQRSVDRLMIHPRGCIGDLDDAYAAVDYHAHASLVQMIKTLKSARIDVRHARLIAAALAREIEPVYRYAGWSCDLIVPAPTSGIGIKKRGFNHADLIARALARRLDIPFADLLVKNAPSSQKQLRTAAARQEVKGTIRARRNVKGRVLVVDDVITTGATMSECARALKAAGATEVCGLAVAAT